MAEINWEKCEEGSVCPKAAVKGDTCDNAPIVAAAHHGGGFIPGMYLPQRKVCIISWDCKAHYKEDYYVLNACGTNLAWVEASDGNVPVGALEAGVARNGETLYVGRYMKDGKMHTGKVHPSHKVCYIPVPDGNKEENSGEYEVLCLKTVKMSSAKVLFKQAN